MILPACRRRSLWLPLFLPLVLTAACSFNRSKAPSGNNSSSTGSTAFTPSSDPRKDLRDALERLNSAYPYRLTETSTNTSTGPATPGGTRVVEFAAKDRYHVKWTNGPLGSTEIITIGDKRYTRVNNGNWTEGAPAGIGQRQDMEKRMREMLTTAVKDVQYLGTETINGVPCHMYTFTMGMDISGQHYASAGKAWIGSGDGLLHQMYSETTVSSYMQKSNITYEYNVDFKVEKPM